MSEKDRADSFRKGYPNMTKCACELADVPCKPSCSCAHGWLSGGCLLCATYGSPQQQKQAAENIQMVFRQMPEVNKVNPKEFENNTFTNIVGFICVIVAIVAGVWVTEPLIALIMEYLQ